MTTGQLNSFFEENEFEVRLYESGGLESAEIETWTNARVEISIMLEPFTVSEFEEYVKNFSVDKSVDYLRRDELYRKCFTVRQSLEDFESFHDELERILTKLNRTAFSLKTV